MGNLILFGAGASFGSEDDSRLVPPLGSDLFGALQSFNPAGWGAIDQHSADQFMTDFEEGMRAFSEANPGAVDVLQRAMAAFFFQFTPVASSRYIRLAHRIKACHWGGALASLNYERLVELSLRHAGVSVVVGGTQRGATELCLPHGCCHLFGQVRTSGNVVLGRGIVLDGGQIRVLDRADEHMRELQQSGVPPVMSYFQPNKETRSGVSFISQQRRRFAELVEAAQAVAIIGVRVRPCDTHIWGPLAKASARIIYRAGQRAGDEFSSWSDGVGRSCDEVIGDYWAAAFDAVCSFVGIGTEHT